MMSCVLGAARGRSAHASWRRRDGRNSTMKDAYGIMSVSPLGARSDRLGVTIALM